MHFKVKPKKSYRKTWIVGLVVPMPCWTCRDIIWLEHMIVDKSVFDGSKMERCQACWAATILERKERDSDKVDQQMRWTTGLSQSQIWPFSFPPIGGTIGNSTTTTPTSNP